MAITKEVLDELLKEYKAPTKSSIRPPLRLKPSRIIRQTGAFIGAPAQPHILLNTA